MIKINCNSFNPFKTNLNQDKTVKIWSLSLRKLAGTIVFEDLVTGLDVKDGLVFTYYKRSKGVEIHDLNMIINEQPTTVTL